MLPRVTLHNAVSLDCRLLEWGMVDMGLYYGVIGAFNEQATLAGAETLLTGAAHEGIDADAEDAPCPQAVPGDVRPLLIVPDSRGRVRMWRWMLSQPYWRAGVALCSSSTPREHMEYLERSGVARIVAGAERVDLKAALSEVSQRYGVERAGNALADPHGEFTGRNILYEARPIEAISGEAGGPVDDVTAALNRARQVLLRERNLRSRPQLDDKVLTAWNGLMIGAFARASRVVPKLAGRGFSLAGGADDEGRGFSLAWPAGPGARP